jgi:hypothetical protein
MQKLIFLQLCFLFYNSSSAQFSFGAPKQKSTDKQIEKSSQVKNIKNQLAGIPGIDTIISTRELHKKLLYKNIYRKIDSIYDAYHQKRIVILSNDTLEDRDELITALVKERDSLINDQKKVKRLVKYWERHDRFEEIKQGKNFFPAYYSTQAIRFFEDDTTHLKLFQNNLINYSPTTKKMTLYTEAVNDYLGPFRVGIGFQIDSESKVDSLSTTDSTQKFEKKTDMLSDIQNGGGDISLNIKYPVIKSSNPNSALQYKFYLYANSAFSLPVLNKASDDFLFNCNGGVEGVLYAKGFNDRLTFYAQLRAAYYNGNRNYRKVITDADKNDPTSFAMFETSFGLDFLDGYRLRVDLFYGSSFIKNNFPATITFIVRPGKND